MGSIKELLELRKQIKAKKPNFIRQDTNKKKRLKKKWRKPKGLHSKLGAKLKGRPKHVSKGYRSPKKARNLHKSGLQQCIVNSAGGLEQLDAKKNCVVISSSVGDRKRIIILKKAKEEGFNVVNIKNVDDYIKKAEEKIQLRKKSKEEEKGKAKETKAVEKKEVEEELTKKVEEESKKETEKKEKDKILTKRSR
ncbi:50S ribosomal protein L32e [Candidatus Woesearchaeota archaeon]|nr:50S ribosomal protein L32e [Candidatus Woesearchaeota archaeon]